MLRQLALTVALAAAGVGCGGTSAITTRTPGGASGSTSGGRTTGSASSGGSSTAASSSSGTSGAWSSSGTTTGASSVATLTAFALKATDNAGLTADVAGVIAGADITLNLPTGTDVTALVPTVTFEGQRVSPASGTAQDFTSPAPYVVTAPDGTTATYTVTAIVVAAPACNATAAACSLSVYDRAVAFAANHPHRDNGTSWDGYCAALMVEFGGFGIYAPSAIAAYHNSTIVSTDPTAAPIGAFHYWNIGQYGHVGVDLLGGGAVVFMASSHVGDTWAPSVGVTSVGAYAGASGATYLGWSMEYDGHGQQLAGGGDCGAVSVPSGCAIPKTPAQTSGVPDHAFVMRLQQYAAQHGYTGAIDGRPDAATWKGVQKGLQAYGYTGAVDGLPGSNTYKAFQRLAAAHGYTGPADGVLGPNTVRGFAKFLNDTY